MSYFKVRVSYLDEVQMTARAVKADTEEQAKAIIGALAMENELNGFEILSVEEDDLSDLPEDFQTPQTTDEPTDKSKLN